MTFYDIYFIDWLMIVKKANYLLLLLVKRGKN